MTVIMRNYQIPRITVIVDTWGCFILSKRTRKKVCIKYEICMQVHIIMVKVCTLVICNVEIESNNHNSTFCYWSQALIWLFTYVYRHFSWFIVYIFYILNSSHRSKFENFQKYTYKRSKRRCRWQHKHSDFKHVRWTKPFHWQEILR